MRVRTNQHLKNEAESDATMRSSADSASKISSYKNGNKDVAPTCRRSAFITTIWLTRTTTRSSATEMFLPFPADKPRSPQFLNC